MEFSKLGIHRHQVTLFPRQCTFQLSTKVLCSNQFLFKPVPLCLCIWIQSWLNWSHCVLRKDWRYQNAACWSLRSAFLIFKVTSDLCFTFSQLLGEGVIWLLCVRLNSCRVLSNWWWQVSSSASANIQPLFLTPWRYCPGSLIDPVVPDSQVSAHPYR